jgi:hypothetical protein
MEWLIDQRPHREHPRDGFDTRKMPLRMFAGFETRIERVRREIADPDRRNWFRHHFGAARYKNKGDIWDHLELCRKTLDRYPHLPWTTPSVDPSESDVCTRHICCGWRHPDARTVRGVIMGRSEYAAISQAAFESDMSVGDLTATLLLRHLRDRHNEMPNINRTVPHMSPGIPTQRS